MRDLFTYLLMVAIAVIASLTPVTVSATPIQDANLVMWLDGNDIDGDGVAEGAGENYIIGGTATWADKSPAAPDNTSTQSLASRHPSMTVGLLNGSNYLTFDGADVLAFSGVDIVGGTAFVIARHGNSSNGQLLGGATGNRQFRFQANLTGAEITGSPSLGVPSASGDTSVFSIVGAEVTASTSRVALNGSFGATKGHADPSFTYGNVGARNVTVEPLTGDIAEVIVYDRNLNSAERIVTENYLNSKYDIDSDGSTPIANDHYAGDLSTNGDYDSDVFGIGRVDGSNVLTLSSSAGLSLEETGGTLDSGEFVLAGHKTTTNGLTTAGLPDGRQRWERVWYLDNNVGSVDATLGFDWSDSGLVDPFDPRFNTLIYSALDPFSFSDLVGASSIAGDQVLFNLSDLQTGYYTLAQAPVPEPSTGVILLLGLCGLARRRRRRQKS